MYKVLWISRHCLTKAQWACIQTRAKQYGHNEDEIVVSQKEIVFSIDNPWDDLTQANLEPNQYNLILGVFPQHTLIQLLPKVKRIGGFVNYQSSRAKGLFICQSMWVAYLGVNSSNWPTAIINLIPCPIPIEEQEPSNLVP